MEKKKITRLNKCYNEIDSLVIVIAALAISLEYKQTGGAEYNEGDYVAIEALSSRKQIRLPLYGPIETALKNLKPDSIEITIEDLTTPTVSFQANISSLQKTINYISSPYFVTFYENNYPDAKNKFGSVFSSWPTSWRMGWVVRNALSHNGRFFFKDMSTPPINWKLATISPANQNTPLSDVMSFADILLLMFEMENDIL